MRNILGHDPSHTYIVDIESDNLNVTYDSLARVYLVGVMSVSTGEYTLHTTVPELSPLNTYVYHNASFDVPALRLRGQAVPNYYCTMVGSHTLHPESSEYHSLGSLQPNVKKKLRDILTEHGYDFKGVPKGEEYKWYGTGDTILDALVEEYLVRDLNATRTEYIRQVDSYTVSPAKLVDVLLTVNMPYVERIISMEQGMRVVYDESIASTLSEAANRTMKALLSLYPYVRTNDIVDARRVPFPNAGYKTDGQSCSLVEFNPNSNAQVTKAMTDLYQWEPKVITKGGLPSTSAEVLEALDYPLCGELLEYSKATKLLSFCGALKECNGWIRPSYNQCATRTTRLSASNPNVQQVPARDKTGKLLRKMFTARDGYTLLVGDQSGFQLRIAAAYMSYYFDDGRLAECFNRGEDVHQFFADIYGIPRKVAKNVTFGWMFGAGVNKMTATANRGNPNPIHKSVVQGALDSLVTNMPALPGVKQMFIDAAIRDKGIIHDWLGTQYVIPELLSKDKTVRASGERKVFNYVVQGLESSLFRHLQNKSATYVNSYGGRQCIVVHDEVGYEVPTELAPLIIPELNRIMSPAFSEFTPETDDVHRLRLECEFSAGNNWLDSKGE